MPYYDLSCKNCLHQFNVKATIQERSDRLIRCPECQSTELEAIYRTVNFVRRLNKDCDVCPRSGSRSSGQGFCSGGACSH
ncbi:MAG: FmdB family zinc ribbon protein [Saccharofermentanales bacterium]|jgi:putative FmdB family regulatory protein|nr:zinc ribbon domain-containing protein [Clostridiaceae bacterium]